MVDNDNDIEEGIITWSQTLERQANMIIRSPFKNKQKTSIMINIGTTQNKNKVQIVKKLKWHKVDERSLK
jgi:hypothetical protein